MIADELSNIGEIERFENDDECDICHEKYVGYIIVEQSFKSYCFACYNREFGHERFMRMYNNMNEKTKIEGFDRF